MMYNFGGPPPSSSSPPRSSSSSTFLGDSRTKVTMPKAKPKIRIIHIFAPEIIKTDADNFQQLVQRLTGNHPTCTDHHRRKKIKMTEMVAAAAAAAKEEEEEDQELLNAASCTSTSPAPPKLQEVEEEILIDEAENELLTRELWNFMKQEFVQDDDSAAAAAASGGDLLGNADHVLFHGLEDILPLILPMNPPQLDFLADDHPPTSFSFLPVR